MNVLVVGATGYLGSEVCRRLRERGHEVRALVRPTSEPERVAALRDLGCVPVAGDLKEEVSVGAACAGMQVVVSTATTTRSRQAGEGLESVDRDGQAALVEAAKAAGVERFVYVSFSGNIGEDDPLTLAKRGTEARVRESGMTWCVLRPSCFMEAWLSPELGFDYPNATATIFGAERAS